MTDFAKVGTARDVSRHMTLARVDNTARMSEVHTARRFIYEQNYGIDSKAVETVLKSQSLMPMVVSDQTT